MPEPIKNEETENRIHSLCLFDVANITVLNRCAHCPGAARAALQHLRCPKDESQPNIFHAVDPESSKLPTESGSSNKGKGKLHYEVGAVLLDQVARLSLGDSSTAPSIQQSDAKRKANSEPDGQEKGKKKISVSLEAYNHLSIEYLKTKPLKPFRDSDFENPFVPGSWPNFDLTSFPGNSFVPGLLMDTNIEGHGVIGCKDGLAEMYWQS